MFPIILSNVQLSGKGFGDGKLINNIVSSVLFSEIFNWANCSLSSDDFGASDIYLWILWLILRIFIFKHRSNDRFSPTVLELEE
jgi:hypothetical protein